MKMNQKAFAAMLGWRAKGMALDEGDELKPYYQLARLVMKFARENPDATDDDVNAFVDKMAEGSEPELAGDRAMLASSRARKSRGGGVPFFDEMFPGARRGAR